jgi:hypothetical protein
MHDIPRLNICCMLSFYIALKTRDPRTCPVSNPYILPFKATILVLLSSVFYLVVFKTVLKSAMLYNGKMVAFIVTQIRRFDSWDQCYDFFICEKIL